MEHFIYRRPLTESDKDELLKYRNVRYCCSYALVFYCPECGTDLIGYWQFADTMVYINGNESPFNNMYSKQFEEYSPSSQPYTENDARVGGTTRPGTVKKSKLLLAYQKEFMQFLSMTHCPICGEKLAANNRHCFGIPTTNIYCDPEHQRYSFGASFNDSKAAFMVKPYILTDCTETPLRDEYDVFRDKEDDWEQISVGAEKGKMVTYRGLKAEITGVWKDNSRLRIKFFDHNDIDSIIAHLREVHKRDKRIAGEKQVQQLVSKNSTTCSHSEDDNINTSSVDVKKFVGYLVTLEKNIYGLIEWLQELYFQQAESEQNVKCAQGMTLLPLRNQWAELNAEYESVLNTDPSSAISMQQFAYKEPGKPSKPKEPAKPQLKKSNIFNRRRINQENEEMMRNYEQNMARYEQAMADYSKAVNTRKEKIKLLKKEQEEKYNSAVEKAKQEHRSKCEMLKQKCDEVSAELEKHSASGENTPQAMQLAEINQAITQAKTMLAKHYKTLDKMYACNVVYGKYRNFVELSTIYEYLMSGRCSTLEGPDGAYNLLESEKRMDMVVLQLSQVVQSLEQIKNNQYALYSAIKETNAELATLNRSVRGMAASMNEMSVSLNKIQENTAITAFNTEVTAYYSKKNAELTNALGYLVALS